MMFLIFWNHYQLTMVKVGSTIKITFTILYHSSNSIIVEIIDYEDTLNLLLDRVRPRFLN